MQKNKVILSSILMVFVIIMVFIGCAGKKVKISPERKPASEGQPMNVGAFEGHVPSDAVVLFDGTDLSEWTYTDGKPAGWIISDGAMTIQGGGIMTKREFGDMQLHIEFATPADTEGKEGQNSGNSGVYLQGIYEVQVLDSYENETYPDGMCGAVYGQYPPLVNSSRPSGEWQVYDIIFHAPVIFKGQRFGENGEVVRKATVTILHNGVLIQDHVEIGVTLGGVRNTEGPRGPIYLQDHDQPVRYRNIWVKEL